MQGTWKRYTECNTNKGFISRIYEELQINKEKKYNGKIIKKLDQAFHQKRYPVNKQKKMINLIKNYGNAN